MSWYAPRGISFRHQRRKGVIEMIAIGKKYAVGSDSMNIILFRRGGTTKDGSDRWNADAYFGKFQNLLTHLVDQGVRETELADLKTVKAKQDELYRLIKSIKLPCEVATALPEPPPSVLQELPITPSDATGCNIGADRESPGGMMLQPPNRGDVTEKIAVLANQGLSSRKIASQLNSQGIAVSHMTVARVIKAQGVLAI